MLATLRCVGDGRSSSVMPADVTVQPLCFCLLGLKGMSDASPQPSFYLLSFHPGLRELPSSKASTSAAAALLFLGMLHCIFRTTSAAKLHMIIEGYTIYKKKVYF